MMKINTMDNNTKTEIIINKILDLNFNNLEIKSMTKMD